MDKAVQPAHVEALRGTVIHGISRQSAIYFPESKTLPPPAAITESLLFFEMMFFILEMSSKQQSNSKLAELTLTSWFFKSRKIFFLRLLVLMLLPKINGLLVNLVI